MLDSSGKPKIADFGISKLKAANDAQATQIGTPGIFKIKKSFLEYMAPEILRSKICTPKADVYSFGLLAFSLITGKRPFFELESSTSVQIMFEVMKGYRPPIPTETLPSICDLIKGCWEDNESKRWTVAQALDTLSKIDIKTDKSGT